MDSKKVRVTTHVKQNMDIDVPVGDVIQAINELPLAQRMNAIAVLIRGIDVKSGELSLEHCQFIVDYLQDKLTDFMELLQIKKRNLIKR